MADNSDDKSLDNSAIPQTENPAYGNSLSDNTETITSNQQVENMEVHHHPKTEKKHLKEYFLEGLFIFIAVSLGFIAENIREHYVNKEIEKRNIEMVVGNLKEDVEQLNYIIKQCESKIKSIDTLVSLQSLQNMDTLSTPRFIGLLREGLNRNSFQSNTAAVDQMKSSGSLRLIKNQKVLEGIYKYEYWNKILVNNFDYDRDYQVQAVDELSSFAIMDENTTAQFFAAQMERLKSKDETINNRQEIFRFFNHLRSRKRILQGFCILQMQKQLKNAEELIELLEKEYDIKG